MKKYAFGVDIGGTTVKMGLFETSGKLLDTWEIPTRHEENGKYILGDIAEAVYQKRQDAHIAKEDIEGIGMGVPGPLKEDGTVLKCVNLGWDVFNAAQAMEERTGFTVQAGNDANVAALGEMWQGGGQGHENLVMVTLGTGVGGGIILDGQILAGTHGAAGEIGHLHMKDDETECCGCGKKGCLEQYASATGIVRLARQYMAQDSGLITMLRGCVQLTAKDIFDAAKANDVLALRLVDEVGDLLGKGLAQIACVVDPEVFVLGGGMAKAGDILVKAIQRHFSEYAFHACRSTEFKLAQLGNNAGIYGGVKLVLTD